MNNIITIGYMTNPDKVYYNDLDNVVVNKFEGLGASVILLELREINFRLKDGEFEMYKDDHKITINGFLSYGYMSDKNYEVYSNIVSTLHIMNIPCLYNSDEEKILDNKFLQYVTFTKNKIPIPMTSIGFSVQSYKTMANKWFPGQSVLKLLNDYGGDGVSLQNNPHSVVNKASKSLWKNQNILFQEFIKGSEGKSIRVLCLNGKATACAQYNDKVDSFRSNISYTFEFFSLDSLMNSPKLNDYYELAQKAVASIGNLTISGVDIIDIEGKGMFVLEVNKWPDIFDISLSVDIDIFSLFAKTFYEKVLANKKV